MKQLDKILVETNNILELALTKSRVTVVVMDRELRYLSVSNPLWEFNQEQVVGKTIAQVHGNEHASKIEPARRKVIETGIAYNDFVELKIDDKKRSFDTTVQPIFNSLGEVDGVTIIWVELTDIVESRRAIAAAHQRLVELLGKTLEVRE